MAIDNDEGPEHQPAIAGVTPLDSRRRTTDPHDDLALIVERDRHRRERSTVHPDSPVYEIPWERQQLCLSRVRLSIAAYLALADDDVDPQDPDAVRAWLEERPEHWAEAARLGVIPLDAQTNSRDIGATLLGVAVLTTARDSKYDGS